MRLKSPDGLRISTNSSISGWCTSRYTAAEPRRSEPCEIASVSESMTRTNGMMPEVWPQPLTGSPIERTSPQYVPMPPPFDASQTFSVQVLDDAAEIVLDGVQEARDRQAALGAAVAQDRRGRHEPEARHVVVQALRVLGVVGVGARDAREQMLRRLARHQVPILERRAAEVGQQRVARGVDDRVARLQRGRLEAQRYDFRGRSRRRRDVVQ